MGVHEFLRNVPLFEALPEEDLVRLCDLVEVMLVPPGYVIFSENDPGDRAYLIRDGEIEVLKTSSGREVLLAVRKTGDLIGEVALLEDSPRMATARARGEAVLFAIGKDTLDGLMRDRPSAARAMFSTVLGRWRATEAMLRQSERLAQLGTLSAGVAHELNNPAAAVRRGADQLRTALSRFASACAGMAAAGVDTRAPAILGLMARLPARPGTGGAASLDALERADRIAAIEDRLAGVIEDESGELAAALADLGVDVAAIDRLAQSLAPAPLGPALSFLAAQADVDTLLAEITQGAARVSKIVEAIRSYAFLDQGPVQLVDVHRGLDDTLLVLHHKLGPVARVVRAYASDVPSIQAHGSELNQVWTNLLDNAADALSGRSDGEITITTRRDGAHLVVEIGDNGPGIPPAVLPRVFEPFFTTKPPGKGAGLGLDVSWRIVVHRHRGDLRVTSQPGATVFQVWLPLDATGDTRRAPQPVPATGGASDDEIRALLLRSHTIAVVGASARLETPAHQVPAYLSRHGYRIVPVNPTLDELFGEPARPDLRAIPEPVDVVLIFRRAEAVPAIVEDAIAIGAKAIWMQEGIVHEPAAAVARAAGLFVVMDACMRSAHRRLLGAKANAPR